MDKRDIARKSPSPPALMAVDPPSVVSIPSFSWTQKYFNCFFCGSNCQAPHPLLIRFSPSKTEYFAWVDELGLWKYEVAKTKSVSWTLWRYQVAKWPVSPFALAISQGNWISHQAPESEKKTHKNDDNKGMFGQHFLETQWCKMCTIKSSYETRRSGIS